MIDLTAITTPFGLLDAETQEALKAHGGPYEFLGKEGGWFTSAAGPFWFPRHVYRVKPQPHECWIKPSPMGDPPHVLWAEPGGPHEYIHFREVVK